MAVKILIVDDEEAILFAMERYLSTCGFDVDVANGSEAKSLIQNMQYMAIITDLRMGSDGGLAGLEVVRLAREKCPSTRTIVLTAYGTPSVEEEAASLGVDAFLHKPKPLPDIAQILLNLLEPTPGASV